MSLVGSSLFLTSRTLVYTAVAAIEANTGYGSVVYSCLVNVVNLGDINVVHRTIVKKVVVVPTSTFEAVTKVTETIVNPAIEANLRTPIAIIENISAVLPIPSNPESRANRLPELDPRARNPEIVVSPVGPIARNPQIPASRTAGLLIHWQLRRTNANGDAHSNLSSGLSRDRE